MSGTIDARGCDRPSLRDLNRHVKKRVVADWERLCFVLFEGDATYTVIKANNRDDSNGCCNEMFRLWLKRSDATWNQLKNALKDIECCRAAVEIEHMLIPEEHTVDIHMQADDPRPQPRLAGCIRPIFKHLDKYVKIQGFSSYWYDLGLELFAQEDQDALYEIERNYGRDVNDCCKQMFRQWLENSDNATWDELVQALLVCDLPSEAKKISNMLIEEEEEEPTLLHSNTGKTSDSAEMESITALENKLKELNAELLERNSQLKIENDKVVELQEENQKLIQKQMEEKVEHEDKVQRLDADLQHKSFQLKVENDKNVKLREENQRLIEDQKEEKIALESKLQLLDVELLDKNSQLKIENVELKEEIQRLIHNEKEVKSAHENKLKQLNVDLSEKDAQLNTLIVDLSEKDSQLNIQSDKVVKLQEKIKKLIHKQEEDVSAHKHKLQQQDAKITELQEEMKDKRSALESQLEKLNAGIVELKEEKILYENKLQLLDADLEHKNFQLKVESDKNVELQNENQRLIEDQKVEKNAHLIKLQKINAERFKERSQNDTKIKELNEDYQTLSKKLKAESEEASTHEPENDANISGNNKPSMRLLNRPKVRNGIAVCWESLGFELLNEKQCVMLEIIKRNDRDIRECCTQMLRYWLEVDTKASWNKLITALQVIHQESMAMFIKKEILKETEAKENILNIVHDDENDTDQNDDSYELAIPPLFQQLSKDANDGRRKIRCCLLM